MIKSMGCIRNFYQLFTDRTQRERLNLIQLINEKNEVLRRTHKRLPYFLVVDSEGMRGIHAGMEDVFLGHFFYPR